MYTYTHTSLFCILLFLFVFGGEIMGWTDLSPGSNSSDLSSQVVSFGAGKRRVGDNLSV